MVKIRWTRTVATQYAVGPYLIAGRPGCWAIMKGKKMLGATRTWQAARALVTLVERG